jgi:site-specific DNA recombinase
MTKQTGTGTRTAIYTRISRDAEGERLGVERQRQDLDDYATDQGLTIVARFEDNDIGASRRTVKRRPDYERMLEEARAGRFDVILAYTSSRLTRRMREHLDLIDLAESHRIKFRYKNSPAFNLNTADGRMIANMLAATDAAESDRISERVARAAQQRAEHGEWHGGWPPCGYTFIRDKADRITGLRVDRARARVLKEMAQRVVEGESLYALCRDLNLRKLKTPPGALATEGAMWRSRTLKRALVSPALIGMREYDGELRPGRWKPILDRDTWDRVRDVLLDPERTDPKRKWMTDTSRKRALSGLMICGGTYDDGAPCGKTLVSSPWAKTKDKPKTDTMICSSQATLGCGHVRINYQPVEDRVVRMLIARLDTEKMRKALAVKEDTTTEETKLRRSVTDVEKRLTHLNEEWTDIGMTNAEYRVQRERLTKRIDDARRALASLTGQRSADVANGEDLADRLAGASVERQRAILETFIDAVVIAPQPKGVPTHVTQRREETDKDYAQRLADLRASTLAQRVKIKWRNL